MADQEWRDANRANWNERTAVDLGPGSDYDLGPLRAGRSRLDAAVRSELVPVAGLRVLHLQCRLGQDTLTLAHHAAAAAVGLDFSAPAIAAVRGLAAELGMADRVRFVEAVLSRCATGGGGAERLDLVFVTWGALPWPPDLIGWAGIVTDALRPGGWFLLAEGHPAALVFDDAAAGPEGQPDWFAPYFGTGPPGLDDPTNYTDANVVLRSIRTHSWMHALGEVVAAIRGAGLSLDWLHGHPRLPWRMFRCLVRDADGMFTWPGRPWLPLGYSLSARKPDLADAAER